MLIKKKDLKLIIFYPEKLEKEEQPKPKASRRKGIAKIRAQENERIEKATQSRAAACTKCLEYANPWRERGINGRWGLGGGERGVLAEGGG